jgi:hypothetical protein
MENIKDGQEPLFLDLVLVLIIVMLVLTDVTYVYDVASSVLLSPALVLDGPRLRLLPASPLSWLHGIGVVLLLPSVSFMSYVI